MNIKNLDLNLLVVFDALATECHVSRAAARVGLTQPAMSNALARLRSSLGDPVLVRTGRTMVLTARARELAAPVRQAMHLLSQAVDRPASSQLESRTIVIGATEYAEHLLLPRLLSLLGHAVPGVRLVVRRLRTLFQAPEDELQMGVLNLSLGFFPEASSLRPGIHSQHLFDDDNVCVVRRGNPLVRKHLSLKQYATLRHVSIFYQNDGSSILDRLLLAKGYQRVVALQVPHFSSAMSVVARTDLVTMVPRRFALEFSRRLPLRWYPAPLPVPPVSFSMLWHSRDDHDPGVEVVRKTMITVSKKRGGLRADRS